MAKKKATKKEVSRKEINGNIIITFDDGSIQIIPAAIDLTAEEAEAIFGSEEEHEAEPVFEDNAGGGSAGEIYGGTASGGGTTAADGGHRRL